MRRRIADLGATVADPVEAAAWADGILWAVPWVAAEESVHGLGSLDGKILVDATNPVAMGMAGFRPPAESGAASGAEAIARRTPGASVVKAFNTAGAANLARPGHGDHAVPVFLCGSPEAKGVVAGLARGIGVEVIDLGGLDHAGLTEALAGVRITLAYEHGMGPDFALAMVRRRV